MTWQVAFQTFSTGLAGIAVFFLYDLVKEYKSFKKDVADDLASLREERRIYKEAVMRTLLKFEELRLTSETSIKVINQEMIMFKRQMNEISEDTKSAHSFMKKAFGLAKALNERSARHEKDIQALKVQIGDTIIFKSGK